MSSTIPVTNLESEPALNDPSFFSTARTDHPLDYDPVEYGPHGLQIAAPHDRLPIAVQQAILGLWRAGHESAASAFANCGRHGSVHQRCKLGNQAKAHRHVCHLWIHDYCGKAENRLHCWLRLRDPEVRKARQWGIEIRGPLSSNLEAQAAKIMRRLKRHGISSVCHPVISPMPRFAAVRIVIRSDRSPFADVRDHLRRLVQAPGYCTLSHPYESPGATLRWMFEATADVLKSCGHTRTRLYLKYFRKQFVRTSGDFYRELADAEVSVEDHPEELVPHPEVLGLPCSCGECDGTMEKIPWQDRHTQSVEAIEEQYHGRVDWHSCYDPFLVRRDGRISHMPNLMANSTTTQPQDAAGQRYGPS